MFKCKIICDRLNSSDTSKLLTTNSDNPHDMDYIVQKLKKNNYESIYTFAWEMTDFFNLLTEKYEKDTVEYNQIIELNQLYNREFQVLDNESKELTRLEITSRNQPRRRRPNTNQNLINSVNINQDGFKHTKTNNKENFKTPLTVEEKLELKTKLRSLSKDGLRELIKIIGDNNLKKISNGGFELDFEILTNVKLREIAKFVDEYNSKRPDMSYSQNSQNDNQIFKVLRNNLSIHNQISKSNFLDKITRKENYVYESGTFNSKNTLKHSTPRFGFESQEIRESDETFAFNNELRNSKEKSKNVSKPIKSLLSESDSISSDSDVISGKFIFDYNLDNESISKLSDKFKKDKN